MALQRHIETIGISRFARDKNPPQGKCFPFFCNMDTACQTCAAEGGWFARRKMRRCGTRSQESQFCPLMAGAQWWQLI